MKVASGIGDVVWVLMKTIATGEKFIYHLPENHPRRGHQVFEMLPQVTAGLEYVPNMGYKILKQNNIQRRKAYWSEIDDKEFYLCANRHLELGYRIEHFLPDLPVSFTLPYQISEEARQHAAYLLQDTTKRYLGVYTSAYSSQRNWGFWGEKKWLQLIQLCYKQNPNQVFVLIGADWDTDLITKLDNLLVEAKIPFINTVGVELPTVIEMMRRFSYAFYFPSGLPIVSETAGGSDCVMFMPPHLEKMIGSYAHPDRIKSGGFKECLFCEPEKIFKWVKDEYKLYDRL